MKGQRGKFYDNLNAQQYRSVFNPTVSGIKLINVVNHHSVIERKIKAVLENTNYQTDKKKYGILTHVNRVFISYILADTTELRNATPII